MIPTLDGVHHLKLPVTDLTRSIAWYASRLGYAVAVEFHEDGHLAGVVLDHPAGGPQLGLRLDPDRARAAAGFDYFAIGADPVGSLWLDTDGRPETCHRFADFLEPRLGAIDELRIAFTGDGLLWAGLAMHRDRGEAPFSHSDRDVLRRMIPTVVDGLRHSLFHGVPVEGNDRWIQAPAVIMVTASGFQASSAGLAAIDDLGGLDHGDLPTSMLSVVGSVRSGAPAAMVRTRDTTGRWVTIRAAPLSDGASVVLSVTATSAVELFPLATGAFGLTRREQEVADLVLQGTSTAAIAKALVLSPHTVQDHLKSIFRKFGVASRRDLVGRFIGTQ
ncbi:MAG: LuxR family transcriptional regulator [Tetrasphaera sp.]|nr:LuxR family transcriptional regulator [Tetrasphaera sp.]